MGFCLVAGLASAQLVLRPQVGITFNDLSEDLDDFDEDLGYRFGADLQIGNKFFVQPGLFFDFRKLDGDDEDYDRTHIRIPVFVGYDFSDDGVLDDLGFRIFGGPTLSFVSTDEGLNIDGEETDFSNTLWGVAAGLGFDFSILFVDAGYEWGLSDLFDDVEDSPKSNSFFINAGVRVRF